MSIIDEFKEVGVDVDKDAQGRIRCLCPFHDDTNPSCIIDLTKQAFSCNSCQTRGSLTKLYAKIANISIQEATVLLGLTNERPIKPETVERYHKQIWMQEGMMEELKARAVTYELIRQYRIGFNEGRITIPVKSGAGNFVNIRRYLPGSTDPSKPKMLSSKGRGKIPQWYPHEQLKYDTILVCGGELKAIVAAAETNGEDIGAATLTGGEGNVAPFHCSALRGKHVIVCMDIDNHGKKAAEIWCRLASTYAKSVKNLVLPFDVKKGDINDYVAMGNSVLQAIKEHAVHWVAEVSETEVEKQQEPPKDLELYRAVQADNTDTRVRLKVDAVAIGESPYVLPHEFKVRCSKDQDCCVKCPVYMQTDKEKTWTVHPESSLLIDMIDRPKQVHRDALGEEVGIPPDCTVCAMDVLRHYTVEDVRVSQTLAIESQTADRSMQHAVVVCEDNQTLDINETYHMVGKMHPHPLTQQATLVISDAVTSDDALSTYQPEDTDKLKVFQPVSWSMLALETKLSALYDDLVANVTQIRQRHQMHLAIDLVYHSCLSFVFEDKVQKGWTDIMVLGDSSQGKSEAFTSLQKFYRLGEKTECKNATVAGLLGGLKQLGKKWFVAWGMVPNNDRRMLCLEEVKGMPVEVISKLTDMRSSGIAELPKIEKRRTHGRTRLLWLSNPRSTRVMSSYNHGVDAILELIGAPEDVRRYDYVHLVCTKDVDQERVQERTSAEHTHTSDLCKELILWGWTRSAEDITFEDTNFVIEQAKRLNVKFTDRLPLLDRGSTRYKVARLAIALAVRTFSSPDGQGLLVRNVHVEYIANMLDTHYSSDSVGYQDMSLAVQLHETMEDEHILKDKINSLSFPKDFVSQMLYNDTFDLTDICDWTGYERLDAQDIVSLLVRKRAVKRIKRRYAKNPPFIQLLKKLLDEGVKERPAHIPEF